MTKVVEEMLMRSSALEKNIDPKGRQLVIKLVKGTGLYEIAVEGNPHFGGNMPRDISGRFTHPTRAQEAIDRYLKETWDENDRVVAQRASRSRTAEKKEQELAANTG